MKFDPVVRTAAAAALIGALFLSPRLASAHDIPTDVTVQAFLKPAGDRLHLLVRVPLKAMRDVDFPVRGKEGFLDIERTDRLLPDAASLWISDFIDLYENNTVLPKPRVVETRVSLPSDRSFASYEEAMAHLTGPKLDTDVFWDQVMLDVLFEYPIHSDQSRFSINPGGLNRLGVNVVTVLRFVLPNGAIRAFEFISDPGLVRLDPQWYQAAGRFVDLGFRHILDGTDHLLFLFCLVIPFRKFRALIPVVTAFTVAHSITLIASAYNLAPDASWFPPLIETLIAVSIVYMALENIVGGATVKRRWMIAFGFGLVHGFGFSFALRQTLQLAGSHMLTSLLSFNIGVELGQLLVLAMLIPALELLFRYAVPERTGTIILSALVAHTAWHWMMDRWGVLSRYRIEMPVLDAALWAGVLRLLMFIVIGGGAVWFVAGLARDRNAQRAAVRVRVPRERMDASSVDR
ncbi:MAG: HupE/UreJ family protein [Acidobacteriota bacterium]